MKLVENSLYNVTTNQALIPGNDSEKLGVVLLSQALGNVRAGYAITDYFAIPFLDYGTQGQNGFENSHLKSKRLRNTVLYSLRLTQNFTMANAVFEVLKFYNWSLVASIFEQSEYGSQMLSIVQDVSATFSTTFVCNKQTNVFRLSPNNGFIRNYCACVERYDKIGVIIIWGRIDYANRVANAIKTQCSGYDNMFFLVADDSDLLYPEPRVDFSLQNSLWVNSAGPAKYGEFLKSCLSAIDGQEAQKLVQYISDAYNFYQSGCLYFASTVDGQLRCSDENIAQELRNDTIAVKQQK